MTSARQEIGQWEPYLWGMHAEKRYPESARENSYLEFSPSQVGGLNGTRKPHGREWEPGMIWAELASWGARLFYSDELQCLELSDHSKSEILDIIQGSSLARFECQEWRRVWLWSISLDCKQADLLMYSRKVSPALSSQLGERSWLGPLRKQSWPLTQPAAKGRWVCFEDNLMLIVTAGTHPSRIFFVPKLELWSPYGA